MSWEEVQIGDLGRIVTGKTPSRKVPTYFGDDYPFVTPSDIDFLNYYCTKTEEGVSEEGIEKHKGQVIPKDAVMFVCIGNTIGKSAIASGSCITNQQINSVIVSERHDEKFVYYLLNHYRETFRGIGIGGGAAQPIINKTKFSNVRVKVPEKRAQEDIGQVLSAYDDMIENNRRRIVLLEEEARQLYREWFVRLRFPGHEHTPITNSLPEGWERRTLGEIAKTNAESYLARELPDEINYIDISSVAQGRIVLKTTMSAADAPGRARRKAHTGDVIWSNVRPNLRAYALILNPQENDVFSTGFTVLSARDVPFTWLYQHVTTDQFVGHLVNHATGVGYPAVRPEDFERAVVQVPPKKILDSFNEATEASFWLIANLIEQDQKLAQARDLLLPRLMSGGLAV